jgi:hypothetical protein
LSEKKWDCDACVRTIDEATRKGVKGCLGGKDYTIRNGNRDFCRVDRCIGNFYTPSIGFWYRAYRQYLNGVLPFPGALLDQPAKVLDVFGVFESLEYERTEAQRKNAERGKPRGR